MEAALGCESTSAEHTTGCYGKDAVTHHTFRISAVLSGVQIITKMGGTPPKLDATPEEDEASSRGQQPDTHNESHGTHRLATGNSFELPSSSKA